MGIKHSKVAGGASKVNGDDWNADHVFTGFSAGDKIRFPVLMTEDDIPEGSANYTINGVEGDAADQLLMIFDGDIHINDSVLYMQFNGDAGNNYGGNMLISRPGNLQDWASSSSAIPITGTPWGNANPRTLIEQIINSKSGTKRLTFGRSICGGDGNIGYNEGYGQWKNTADEITSIKLYGGNGTFHGKVKVYKFVEITF